MKGRRLAVVALAVGSLVSWVGCNLIFGIESGNLVSDGGSSDSPVGDGGGPQPDGAIVVTQRTFYVSDRTTSPVNTDFSNTSMKIHVVEADGGITDYPVVGKGDGTFSATGVPLGVTWYVAFTGVGDVDITRYAYSVSRSLDLSQYVLGRPNVAISDAGADSQAITTRVTYDISGVTQGQYDNQLQYGSVSAGGPLTVGDGGSSAYEPDGGRVTGEDDFTSGIALIDGQGHLDETYVIGYDDTDAGLTSATAVAGAFSTNSLTMPGDGGIGSLVGAMTNGPMGAQPDGGAISFTWDRAPFVALTGEMSTDNKPVYQTLTISAGPSPKTPGGLFALYTYTLEDALAANAAKEVMTPSYVDPYPVEWTRAVNVSLVARGSINVPLPDGGTTTVINNGAVQCVWDLAAVNGGTLVPQVGAPRNVQVNGHPSNVPQTGIGLRPTITWDPPASGAPSQYAVYALDRTIQANPPTRLPTWITLPPTVHEVRFPPGILLTNHYYVFGVYALAAPDNPEVVFQATLPQCFTNSKSQMMTP